MNNVYGNGEAQPEGGPSFEYDFRPKNEYKGKPYIACKHIITNTTVITWDSCVRYVKLYLLTSDTKENKQDIEVLLGRKSWELFKEYVNL